MNSNGTKRNQKNPGDMIMKIEHICILLMASALLTGGAAVDYYEGEYEYVSNIHEPIRIDDNTDFADQGWPGSGSVHDPYIIDGYEIDGGDHGYGIYIGNTTVHFVVRNCYVFNATGNPWDYYHQDTGIYIHNTENGSIENNDILDNSEVGIRIYSSRNNSVADNTLSDNRMGISLSASTDNIIEQNTISNQEIGLRLMNSAENVINDNIITGNIDMGLELFMADNNSFYKNEVSDNENGFHIEFSDHNTIHRNILTENIHGINIVESQGNLIYHNNLIDNEDLGTDDGENDWDNGFPSGGNYWSDHYGDDDYHSSDQNISGSDGIVDIPYYGNGFTDHYPLTDPSPTPHVRIDYPEEGDMISEDSFTAMWSGMQRYTDLLSYELRVNNGEWIDNGYDTAYTLRNITDGEYTLEVKVRDEEENTKTDAVTFMADSPPEISIISPSIGDIFNTDTVTVRWEGHDSMGIYYYEVRVDDGAWIDKDIVTEHTFEDLPDGERLVNVRAWDVTGKNTVASVNFTVDTTPPDIEIMFPVSGELLNREDVTVEWTGSDSTTGIDRYQLRLGNGGWIDVGKDEYYTFLGLSEGEYLFELRGWDTAGNSRRVTVNFTVDLTPPVVTIVSPSSGEVIYNKSITVQWEAHDSSGIDYYEVRIDDGNWFYMDTLTRNTFTELSDGDHTVEVRAWDNAGSNRTESVTFTVSSGLSRYIQPIILVIIAIVGAVLIYIFAFRKDGGGDETDRDFVGKM